jgi:acyl-CoA reductase-like NAD-dependent aldehyde dehydrogenase
LVRSLVTQEQGKPLVESKAEAMAAADIIEWFAEEGFRVYGTHRAVSWQPCAAADGAGRSSRARRGLYAVELSDQSGGAQGRGGACRGVFNAGEGA